MKSQNQNPYNKLFEKLVKATEDATNACNKVKTVMKEISKISHKTHEMDKFTTPISLKQKGGH